VLAGAGPTTTSEATPTVDATAGLPPLPGLPESETPRWCWSGSPDQACDVHGGGCELRPRACTESERKAGLGCPAGTWPRAVDGAIVCRPAGVQWTCPPGFVVDVTAPLVSPGPQPCKPDPQVCPASKWGPWSGAAVVHVDAAAAPGGTGSADKPLAGLAAALG